MVTSCSCGRGPVGHTSAHESTDKPGTIRIVREGKTDQYINLRVAEAQAVDDAAKRVRVEDVERQKATPRVVLSGRDVGFGGRMPCSKCSGSGGSLWEACLYCDGTGLR